MSDSKLFPALKKIILNVLLFSFPLFFLPLTQEYFITNKFYLLGVGVLLLLIISTVEFLVNKKVNWEQKPHDKLVFLIILTAVASTIIISPNKIQAILNPNFGLVILSILSLLYYYISRNNYSPLKTLSLSSVVLSIVTIIFYFQPFAKINLPVSMQFLKNPTFSPIGGQLDLVIFLGFFVVFNIGQLLIRDHAVKDQKPLKAAFLAINTIAFGLTIYSLFKLPAGSFQLPPFSLSWYAAVDILKSPLNAIFGIGIDNFSSIYTKVKDVAYNQSVLWQIPAFTVSRSAVLHVLTETGIFGLAAFGLLLTAITRPLFTHFKKNLTNPLLLVTCYLLLALFLFPVSLPLFVLLFVIVTQTTVSANETADQSASHLRKSSLNLADFIPLYLGVLIISFTLIGILGYFLGRTYLAEYKFKQSIVGFNNNNIKDLYDNQRNAIILNPYLERFRLNFSQTNLLIANNIVNQAIETQKGKDKIELSTQDQETVSQAIQSAIAEGKAVVALNSQKASNWENLAIIYRSVINAVSGPVDTWAAASYQRAIALDPQNPQYRLNLGGIYYSSKVFDEAAKLFEEAAMLKGNWSNAYYNLAWANYQKGDYQRAAQMMQNVINLLDAKSDKIDYDKASAELTEFKKMLPADSADATPAAQQQTNPPQLSLPEPTNQPVKPPVQLPTGAEPEQR